MNNKVGRVFYSSLRNSTAKLPSFQYNSSSITPDGKKVASTLTVLENPDDIWSAQLTFPARIDIATGEYEVLGNVKNLSVWSVLADGRITHPLRPPSAPTALRTLTATTLWRIQTALSQWNPFFRQAETPPL